MYYRFVISYNDSWILVTILPNIVTVILIKKKGTIVYSVHKRHSNTGNNYNTYNVVTTPHMQPNLF